MDLRPLHTAALADADSLVRRVGDGDLDRPTPCAEWSLGTLLAHMVGQHLGFAAAVRDGDAPRSAYAHVPFTVEAWERSLATLVDIFAEADLDAEVVEIELAPTALPVARLVGAQFLDTVVHTWDLARSLDEPYEPFAEVAEIVGRIAAGIPDDERRTAPGAAFAPARPEGNTAWEHTLARLGRDPAWQPESEGEPT